MYLGIDCGTQGTKALLIDESGRALGRGYAPHALIARHSGAREQHPDWWVEALRTSVRQALAQHPKAAQQVLAAGVSGQQHGLVVLDESHRVIRPAKLWNDTETAAQNSELITRFGGARAFEQRFGFVPLTGYTVSKLLWLKQVEPANFARIRHILLPHDYLNFFLTGTLAAEYGDSSGTGFFSPRTRTWIPEILESIDDDSGQLLHALPPLLAPEASPGTLLPAVAAELGLPLRCIVSSGGGDNMMGAIGTGNVIPGVVTLSLGTSSTVYSFSAQPPSGREEDAAGAVAPFCSSSGGWLPLVCTMNCTNVVTQALELVGKPLAAIESALAETAPGASGLTLLPFLNGERTPDLPNARGTLSGLSATNYTASNLIRATIEGVTFGILNGLALVLEESSPERILLIGGGARSSAWRQLLADATGTSIQTPVEPEAGALGAAIQACYAFLHHAGRAETFAALTARMVRLNEEEIATPNPALREPYRVAHALYNERLSTLYAAPPEPPPA